MGRGSPAYVKPEVELLNVQTLPRRLSPAQVREEYLSLR